MFCPIINIMLSSNIGDIEPFTSIPNRFLGSDLIKIIKEQNFGPAPLSFIPMEITLPPVVLLLCCTFQFRWFGHTAISGSVKLICTGSGHPLFS